MLATVDNQPIPVTATTPQAAAEQAAEYGNRGDIISIYHEQRLNRFLIGRNRVEQIQ